MRGSDISPPDEHPDIIEEYRRSFALHGDTPAGVQWPRGRQALRFAALTRHIVDDGFSVLDYGCGLAHLKPYLDQHFASYEYRGVDLVPEFVEAVAAKFPDVSVRQIRSFLDVVEPVDHVVISGTFNIIDGGDRGAYLRRVEATLLHLFELTKVSLAVNFMTDRVDFMQRHALHVNLGEMIGFVQDRMSARVLSNASYMPYEFTLVVLKDAEIQRPDNIYRAIS